MNNVYSLNYRLSSDWHTHLMSINGYDLSQQFTVNALYNSHAPGSWMAMLKNVRAFAAAKAGRQAVSGQAHKLSIINSYRDHNGQKRRFLRDSGHLQVSEYGQIRCKSSVFVTNLLQHNVFYLLEN